jgi:hypothetical protein
VALKEEVDAVALFGNNSAMFVVRWRVSSCITIGTPSKLKLEKNTGRPLRYAFYMTYNVISQIQGTQNVPPFFLVGHTPLGDVEKMWTVRPLDYMSLFGDTLFSRILALFITAHQMLLFIPENYNF